VDFAGMIVDLGGYWIHGFNKKNVMKKLLKEI